MQQLNLFGGKIDLPRKKKPSPKRRSSSGSVRWTASASGSRGSPDKKKGSTVLSLSYQLRGYFSPTAASRGSNALYAPRTASAQKQAGVWDSAGLAASTHQTPASISSSSGMAGVRLNTTRDTERIVRSRAAGSYDEAGAARVASSKSPLANSTSKSPRLRLSPIGRSPPAPLGTTGMGVSARSSDDPVAVRGSQGSNQGRLGGSQGSSQGLGAGTLGAAGSPRAGLQPQGFSGVRRFNRQAADGGGSPTEAGGAGQSQVTAGGRGARVLSPAARGVLQGHGSLSQAMRRSIGGGAGVGCRSGGGPGAADGAGDGRGGQSIEDVGLVVGAAAERQSVARGGAGGRRSSGLGGAGGDTSSSGGSSSAGSPALQGADDSTGGSSISSSGEQPSRKLETKPVPGKSAALAPSSSSGPGTAAARPLQRRRQRSSLMSVRRPGKSGLMGGARGVSLLKQGGAPSIARNQFYRPMASQGSAARSGGLSLQERVAAQREKSRAKRAAKDTFGHARAEATRGGRGGPSSSAGQVRGVLSLGTVDKSNLQEALYASMEPYSSAALAVAGEDEEEEEEAAVPRRSPARSGSTDSGFMGFGLSDVVDSPPAAKPGSGVAGSERSSSSLGVRAARQAGSRVAIELSSDEEDEGPTDQAADRGHQRGGLAMRAVQQSSLGGLAGRKRHRRSEYYPPSGSARSPSGDSGAKRPPVASGAGFVVDLEPSDDEAGDAPIRDGPARGKRRRTTANAEDYDSYERFNRDSESLRRQKEKQRKLKSRDARNALTQTAEFKAMQRQTYERIHRDKVVGLLRERWGPSLLGRLLRAGYQGAEIMQFSREDRAVEGKEEDVVLACRAAVQHVFDALGAPVPADSPASLSSSSPQESVGVVATDGPVGGSFFVEPEEASNLVSRYWSWTRMGNIVRRETSIMLRGKAAKHVPWQGCDPGAPPSARAAPGDENDFLAATLKSRRPHLAAYSIGGQSAMFAQSNARKGQPASAASEESADVPGPDPQNANSLSAYGLRICSAFMGLHATWRSVARQEDDKAREEARAQAQACFSADRETVTKLAVRESAEDVFGDAASSGDSRASGGGGSSAMSGDGGDDDLDALLEMAEYAETKEAGETDKAQQAEGAAGVGAEVPLAGAGASSAPAPAASSSSKLPSAGRSGANAGGIVLSLSSGSDRDNNSSMNAFTNGSLGESSAVGGELQQVPLDPDALPRRKRVQAPVVTWDVGCGIVHDLATERAALEHTLSLPQVTGAVRDFAPKSADRLRDLVNTDLLLQLQQVHRSMKLPARSAADHDADFDGRSVFPNCVPAQFGPDLLPAQRKGGKNDGESGEVVPSAAALNLERRSSIDFVRSLWAPQTGARSGKRPKRSRKGKGPSAIADGDRKEKAAARSDADSSSGSDSGSSDEDENEDETGPVSRLEAADALHRFKSTESGLGVMESGEPSPIAKDDSSGRDDDRARASAGLVRQVEALESAEAAEAEEGSLSSSGLSSPAEGAPRALGSETTASARRRRWHAVVAPERKARVPPPAAAGQFGGSRIGTKRLGALDACRSWWWTSQTVVGLLRQLTMASARSGHCQPGTLLAGLLHCVWAGIDSASAGTAYSSLWAMVRRHAPWLYTTPWRPRIWSQLGACLSELAVVFDGQYCLRPIGRFQPLGCADCAVEAVEEPLERGILGCLSPPHDWRAARAARPMGARGSVGSGGLSSSEASDSLDLDSSPGSEASSGLVSSSRSSSTNTSRSDGEIAGAGTQQDYAPRGGLDGTQYLREWRWWYGKRVDRAHGLQWRSSAGRAAAVWRHGMVSSRLAVSRYVVGLLLEDVLFQWRLWAANGDRGEVLAALRGGRGGGKSKTAGLQPWARRSAMYALLCSWRPSDEDCECGGQGSTPAGRTRAAALRSRMTVSHIELAARSTVAMACRAILAHAAVHWEVTGCVWSGNKGPGGAAAGGESGYQGASGAKGDRAAPCEMPGLSTGAMGLAVRAVAAVLLVVGPSPQAMEPLRAAMRSATGARVRRWVARALHQALPLECAALHAAVEAAVVEGVLQ